MNFITKIGVAAFTVIAGLTPVTQAIEVNSNAANERLPVAAFIEIRFKGDDFFDSNAEMDSARHFAAAGYTVGKHKPQGLGLNNQELQQPLHAMRVQKVKRPRTTIDASQTVSSDTANVSGSQHKKRPRKKLQGVIYQELLPPSHLISVVTLGANGDRSAMSVELTWLDNTDNEDLFVIERCRLSEKGNCLFEPVEAVAANALNFNDKVSPGAYRYRIKAVNAQGSSDYSNIVKNDF